MMRPLLATARQLAERLETEIRARVGRDQAAIDRLKLLISIVIGILILSGLFGMQQIVGTLERRYMATQTDLARLKAQAETNVWQERKQQSQALKSLLEDRLWSAQTPGLADAGFERWLRDRLSSYKMDPMQAIQVRHVAVTPQNAAGGAQDPLANIERMTAKIIVPFDRAGLASFLGDVAESDRAIVIDRLYVRSGRNARVEIDISAFYRSA